MTHDRGIVRGRVSRTPPTRRGPLHLVALPTALSALIVAGVVIASVGVDRSGGEPERLAVAPATGNPLTSIAPEATASPTPTPVTSPSVAATSPLPAVEPAPSPTAVALGGSPLPTIVVTPAATPLVSVVDPFQLPRFPGSDVVGTQDGVDGSVRWTLIEYAVADVSQDEVREHYRKVFRDTDWFVGEVDFTDGVWTFAASQDDREAQLEISVDDDDTVRVSAYVSAIEPIAVPTPTPRAARQRDRDDRRDRIRPRVNRPRLAPNRDRHIPRYRGDDDDGGGDD